MLDHLRGLLVLLHLIAVTAVAFPAPAGMTRADIDNPDVQAAIAAWRGVAGAVGVAVEQEPLSEWLWTQGKAMLAIRRTALAPMQPYYRWCGTRQSWSMFGYLNHTPARLEVHIDWGEGWQPLHIARTREHDWRARQLEQERLRGLVNRFSWKHSRRRFRELADWLAARAHEDYPDALRLRVQMRRRPLPDPATLRAAGTLAHTTAYWPELRELQP